MTKTILCGFKTNIGRRYLEIENAFSINRQFDYNDTYRLQTTIPSVSSTYLCLQSKLNLLIDQFRRSEYVQCQSYDVHVIENRIYSDLDKFYSVSLSMKKTITFSDWELLVYTARRIISYSTCSSD